MIYCVVLSIMQIWLFILYSAFHSSNQHSKGGGYCILNIVYQHATVEKLNNNCSYLRSCHLFNGKPLYLMYFILQQFLHNFSLILSILLLKLQIDYTQVITQLLIKNCLQGESYRAENAQCLYSDFEKANLSCTAMTGGLQAYAVKRNVDGIICVLYRTQAKHYSLFATRQTPNYISEVCFTIIRTAVSAKVREKLTFEQSLHISVPTQVQTGTLVALQAVTSESKMAFVSEQSWSNCRVLWPCSWGASTLLVPICLSPAYQIKLINGPCG